MVPPCCFAHWRSSLSRGPLSTVSRLRCLTTPSDTKSLIETAVTRFLAEVPALQPLKLVVGLDLRGRGDVQLYRVELPGPKVTKDIASDAKVRLEVQRARFNELATKGHISDWRAAFEHGDAKATGIEQVLRLIVNVVEKQEERSRTRRPTGGRQAPQRR
ncbi:MAG: hypothetical protein ACR2JH_08535 [Solirubrobacteraceae bacterium]